MKTFWFTKNFIQILLFPKTILTTVTNPYDWIYFEGLSNEIIAEELHSYFNKKDFPAAGELLNAVPDEVSSAELLFEWYNENPETSIDEEISLMKFINTIYSLLDKTVANTAILHRINPSLHSKSHLPILQVDYGTYFEAVQALILGFSGVMEFLKAFYPAPRYSKKLYYKKKEDLRANWLGEVGRLRMLYIMFPILFVGFEQEDLVNTKLKDSVLEIQDAVLENLRLNLRETWNRAFDITFALDILLHLHPFTLYFLMRWGHGTKREVSISQSKDLYLFLEFLYQKNRRAVHRSIIKTLIKTDQDVCNDNLEDIIHDTFNSLQDAVLEISNNDSLDSVD